MGKDKWQRVDAELTFTLVVNMNIILVFREGF